MKGLVLAVAEELKLSLIEMKPGEIISYTEMCSAEGVNLQRGMNFRLKNNYSVILMSLRPGAPYADQIEDNGRVLIYEGHDIPQQANGPNPKMVNQETKYLGGSLTQNGLFYEAAMSYKSSKSPPELVKVYEKMKAGIWVYNGIFKLLDSWLEKDDYRNVFKFKLEISDEIQIDDSITTEDIDHSRLIPTSVKLEVWKRDGGQCVLCRSKDNLHFDHIIPFSKGGSSLVAKNIQLLCARHNLQKRDRIE